jgi:HD-GYP domain-containing protein (c-di-GMP phosphodiesterase class II)
MIGYDSEEKFVRAIYQLSGAISNMRLYSYDHPYVGQYAEAAYLELADLLDACKSITFFIVGGHIVIKDQPLTVTAQFVDKFVAILKEKGVERVTFDEGITKAELLEFVASLASKGATSVRSTGGVRVGKVELQLTVGTPDAESARAAESELDGSGVPHGDSELDRVRELYTTVARQRRIDVRGVDEVVKRFITGFLWNVNPISLLASLKMADEYTFTHAVNVGILTIIQARNLGYSGSVLHDIGVASMLHDVGKIFIPPEILSKAGRLTAEERTVIEGHTVKGGQYLMTQDGVPKIAVIAAFEHHRRFDGSGYPDIRLGWKPNLVAQMIAVADVFDALRSKRSYSNPKPLREILTIFQKEKGTAFHPVLADSFLKLIMRETLWTPGVAQLTTEQGCAANVGGSMP